MSIIYPAKVRASTIRQPLQYFYEHIFKSPTGPRFLIDSHHALLLDATTRKAPLPLRQKGEQEIKIVCGAKMQGSSTTCWNPTPCEDFTHWLKGGERVSLKHYLKAPAPAAAKSMDAASQRRMKVGRTAPRVTDAHARAVCLLPVRGLVTVTPTDHEPQTTNHGPW